MEIRRPTMRRYEPLRTHNKPLSANTYLFGPMMTHYMQIWSSMNMWWTTMSVFEPLRTHDDPLSVNTSLCWPTLSHYVSIWASTNTHWPTMNDQIWTKICLPEMTNWPVLTRDVCASTLPWWPTWTQWAFTDTGWATRGSIWISNDPWSLNMIFHEPRITHYDPTRASTQTRWPTMSHNKPQ